MALKNTTTTGTDAGSTEAPRYRVIHAFSARQADARKVWITRQNEREIETLMTADQIKASIENGNIQDTQPAPAPAQQPTSKIPVVGQP